MYDAENNDVEIFSLTAFNAYSHHAWFCLKQRNSPNVGLKLTHFEWAFKLLIMKSASSTFPSTREEKHYKFKFHVFSGVISSLLFNRYDLKRIFPRIFWYKISSNALKNGRIFSSVWHGTYFDKLSFMAEQVVNFVTAPALAWNKIRWANEIIVIEFSRNQTRGRESWWK